MTGIDTNILVYAHRGDSAWHDKAREVVEELANGREPWCVPWPCVYEFLGVVTRPRIYDPPTPTAQARAQMAALLANPGVHLLAEDAAFWPTLARVLQDSQVAGPAVHDARIAALCIYHGVTPFYSADRDFSRFAKLRTVNPLIHQT